LKNWKKFLYKFCVRRKSLNLCLKSAITEFLQNIFAELLLISSYQEFLQIFYNSRSSAVTVILQKFCINSVKTYINHKFNTILRKQNFSRNLTNSAYPNVIAAKKISIYFYSKRKINCFFFNFHLLFLKISTDL
jgi:hypothetical protein